MVDEFVVGYWKVVIGKLCMIWLELVDQVFCFGWIDGICYWIDDESYMIWFMLWCKGSWWSDVNLCKVEVLCVEGLMVLVGFVVWEKCIVGCKVGYVYEENFLDLFFKIEKVFCVNFVVWDFFNEQLLFFQKKICYWLVSVKKLEMWQCWLEKVMVFFEKGQ